MKKKHRSHAALFGVYALIVMSTAIQINEVGIDVTDLTTDLVVGMIAVTKEMKIRISTTGM